MMKKIRIKAVYLFGLVSLSLYLSPAAAPAQTPLNMVIEGAKKEGTINMRAPTGMTLKAYERLHREILEKYGVDLKFNHVEGFFTTDLSKAISEQKAGLTPTWDLYNTWGTLLMRSIDAGILEKVDWEPLLAPGTPPGVVLGRPPQLDVLRGYALSLYTAHSGGVIYNPKKIPAHEVPQTLTDLADPKWKGQIGVNKSTSVWLSIGWGTEKKKTLSTLRSILKNGAIVGGSRDLVPRYLMGEISIAAGMSAGFLLRIREKGPSAEYKTLDVSIERNFSSVIRKGAPHLNAAKLVAAYLASPDGYKFIKEVCLNGSLYYPGNFEHEIMERDKKRGLRIIMLEASDLLPFSLSEEALSWEKEIKKILAGG